VRSGQIEADWADEGRRVAQRAEVGHLVFDVPSALGEPCRRYRSVAVCPAPLDRASLLSERRATEFMGALPVPPAAP
jgi:hypothetical protein